MNNGRHHITIGDSFRADPHRILESGTLGDNGGFQLRTLSTQNQDDLQAAAHLDQIVQNGITPDNAGQFEEVARYNLDPTTMPGISKLEAANFMPKSPEWYQKFIDDGNAVYGIFDRQGLLISKAGLVLNSTDITEYGIGESSIVWKSSRDKFNANSRNAIATVLATHPGFQGAGLQKRVLNAAFDDVSSGTHPSGIIKDTAYALVTPTNVGSLKATMRGARFRITELNRHHITKETYFYLEANLQDTNESHTTPYDKLTDADIDTLNGEEMVIRQKIKNTEKSIAICMDIAPEHAETPWNDENMSLLINAFQRGYRGMHIHTHSTRRHEITGEVSNYLIVER